MGKKIIYDFTMNEQVHPKHVKTSMSFMKAIRHELPPKGVSDISSLYRFLNPLYYCAQYFPAKTCDSMPRWHLSLMPENNIDYAEHPE